MQNAVNRSRATQWITALILVSVSVIQRAYGQDVRQPLTNVCKINQLQCNSGACFDRFLLCDGIKHCDDGTDESSSSCGNIPCPRESFKCDYGACIDKAGFCDGTQHCADGSDESPDKCGCKLPDQPENGEYVLSGCRPPACKPVPGDTVRSVYLNYTCHRGFALSGMNVLGCESGWTAPFPRCSPVVCPALKDPSREIECKVNGTKVDCDESMVPGTEADVKCGFFYTHIKQLSRFVIRCQTNGKWSREITPCEPKCGERNPRRLPRIAGGSDAQHGEFPWHVGVYRSVSGSDFNICGGTIISERIVVTAAHCFWNVEDEKPYSVNDFRVAAGKYYSKWNHKDERDDAQKRDIERVVIHNGFGNKNNWANDIALIELKNPFEMKIAVRPICVDNDNEYERFFSPGKTGTVLGWGITETMRHSEKLRMATLKYVSREDCENEVPQSFVPFLTRDKFCAGYGNGTTLCPADDGGGFFTQFARDGKWYLLGIASMGVGPEGETVACDVNKHVTFTRIADHLHFLNSV
ncbi:Serine proteinase stubble [Gryllus bimaculatus]|nr:Serine proteinase stubble [Gryllus bimaculatus]